MKIAIISFTDLSKDPRVNRQIFFLKDKHTIVEFGLNPSGYDVDNYISLSKKQNTFIEKCLEFIRAINNQFNPYFGLTKETTEKVKQFMDKYEFDLIIANDLETLPLIIPLRKQAKVILDAHEYSPYQYSKENFEGNLRNKYARKLCEKYLHLIDGMITVSPLIAEEYYQNFGIKPIVITNATESYNLQPSQTNENEIKIIYHGGTNPERKIENMIKMMDYLDYRFSLDLMLVINYEGTEYIQKIEKMVSERVNVSIIDPVRREDIVPFTNKYDIGLYLLPSSSFNHSYALPNKFFEYIQARLAIAVGPSPEMVNYIKKYNLGISSKDFDSKSLADCINLLSKSEIEFYKIQSHLASKELSSDTNKKILNDYVDSFL